MVAADLILELAVVLMIFVVILTIPRMMGADRESVAMLNRQQVIHHAHPRGEQRHAGSPVKHAA